jgi:hypothetical protein
MKTNDKLGVAKFYHDATIWHSPPESGLAIKPQSVELRVAAHDFSKPLFLLQSSAASAISGASSKILSNALAGPSGKRFPCSQWR